LFAEPLDVTHGDIQRTPQKLDKPPSSNPFLRTTAEIYATVRLIVHGSRNECEEAVRKFIVEMFAGDRQEKGKQE
ncbi:MAG: hypothetical protein ACREYC_28815, partial [Gammaproteobacteria bacterium]